MPQSPAQKTPWLHWPPTRSEWRDVRWMLGAILLSAGFFLACAVWGVDPERVFNALLGLPFAAILLAAPVAAVLFLLLALLRK